MPRDPIPAWFFALVVVRKGDAFLLVQELLGTWYLPAGRVEPGEALVEAARREAFEETGIPVILEGILRVEHTPRGDGTARVRVVFVGRPADERAPKSEADEHSFRAAWFTLEALHHHALRSQEVREILERVAGGGTVYPLSLLGG